MGISLTGASNRDLFVQDLKVSAMTTSLVTAALVLPVLTTGIAGNVNKTGQDMISFSSHPSISLLTRNSLQKPRFSLSTKTLGNSIRERDYDKEINKEV